MTVLVSSQRSFAAGEVMKELYSRADFQKHDQALAVCENFVVRRTGGLTRRPPTEVVAERQADSVLIPHIIGTADGYMLEFGNTGNVRVFRDGGRVDTIPGTPYEIAHSYAAADLEKLRARGSGNDLYVTERNVGITKFTRISNADWTAVATVLNNGPFQVDNANPALRIAASASTGSVFLTGTGFAFSNDDVGRRLKFREADKSFVLPWEASKNLANGQYRRNNGNIYQVVSAGTLGTGLVAPTHEEGTIGAGDGLVDWQFVHAGFGQARITSVNAGVATALVEVSLPNEFWDDTNASWVAGGSTWFAWDFYNSTDGFPDVLEFHDTRLYAFRGNRGHAGVVDDFENFKADTQPDNGFDFIIGLSTRRATEVQWTASEAVLRIGTAGDEHYLRASSLNEGVTATNRRLLPSTDEGAIFSEAFRVGGYAVFADASARGIQEQYYDFQTDRFVASDLVELSRHIFYPRIKKIVWQRNPMRICWVLLTDGSLRAVTYNRAQEIIASHRHTLPADCKVDDIAVLEAANGFDDELWLATRRTFGGVEQGLIERMLPYFDAEETVNAADYIYLDAQTSQVVGNAVTSLGGLEIYEGHAVTVISSVDGLVGEFTVQGGGVTFTTPVPAGRITVGVPFQSRARLLPCQTELRDGTVDMRTGIVKGLLLRITAGPGGFVGDIEDPDSILEPIFLYEEPQDYEDLKILSTAVDVSPDLGWEPDCFVDVIAKGPYAFDLHAAHRVVEYGRT